MSESNKPGATIKDKLIADLKQMDADADALLQATTDQASEKIAGLRTRLQANLKAAPGRLAEFAATDVGQNQARLPGSAAKNLGRGQSSG